MRAKLLSILSLLTLTCATTPAVAFDKGVSISGGYDFKDEITFVRGAIKASPQWRWLTEGNWYVDMHVDLGFIYLESDADYSTTNFPDSLEAISLTPLFRLQRIPYDNGISPFFEAGVGASYFSEDTLQNGDPDGTELGGHFLFEDILSAGLRFGGSQQYELSLNYFHYSNAGIYDNNDGLNVFAATFGFWF